MKDKDGGGVCWFRWCFLGLSVVMGLLLGWQMGFAANVTEVKKLSEKAVDVGVKSQQSFETWVEEKHRLLAELEDMEAQLEHIGWQRKKLDVYKKDLNEKIAGLQKKSEAMEAVNLKLLPILEANLEKLQELVAADVPANFTERRKSLHHATIVLNDYDLGLLDKARAVLNAVAREVDLGHRVGIFEDEIEVAGARKRVKILQVGRVGLYALTLDGQKAYQWVPKQTVWVPNTEAVASIHEAVEMAEGIRLVGLSKLPIVAEKMQEATAQ